MLELILTPLAHLLVLSFFLLLTFRFISFDKAKYMLLFCAIYCIHYLITFLPSKYSALQVINLPYWNWSGKLFSIIFILIIIAFLKNKRAYFLPLNLKIKTTPLLVVMLVFILSNFWLLPHISLETVNWNTFFFQLIFPSISEELLYRSVLLGFLINHIYADSKFRHFNYFLIALLFGLGHALFIGETFTCTFKADDFINSFVFGYFWAWLSHTSKSVYYAISSHALSNILQAFV